MRKTITGAHQRVASRSQIVLAFAAVYVLWGSTYLAIRIGDETIPPFLLAGLRHTVAGLLLLGWLRLRGGAAGIERRHWRSAAIIGALMLLGGNGLVTWAEKRVPSGLAALIVASVPIWMTLLHGLQTRRRPHGVVLLGLALCVAGLAFLVLPSAGAVASNHVDPLGAIALLCAAFFWAIGSLYSRTAPLPSSTLLATAMEMVAGGAILLTVSTVAGEWRTVSLAAVSSRSILALAYLIVAGSLLGFTAYVFLLSATTPARVSTYAFVNPVVAVFFGWAIAGEAVTLRTALSALLIVGAVALIVRYGGRKGKEEEMTREAA
ncbi:MAG TPA: EamA family transporter [Thermoanaerobaculia bacterium]|jgi:drug/metabolite transporter (DMT)-like permease